MKYLICLAFAGTVLVGCSPAPSGNTTAAVNEIKTAQGHSNVTVNPNLPKPVGAGGTPKAATPGGSDKTNKFNVNPPAKS